MDVSVVLPAHNEAANLTELVRRIVATLAGAVVDFEIVVVDDGSTDATVETARVLHDEVPQLRLIVLSRNFGHQAAILAGLEWATGDAVIVMDADMQDPPELFAKMIERWRAGFEVVYAQRRVGTGSVVERVASRAFYFLLGQMTAGVRSSAADFYLLDRKAVDALRACSEHHLYLRGLVGWIGFRQSALVYDRQPRSRGQPAYTLPKRVRLAIDAIVSSSRAPLYLMPWLAVPLYLGRLYEQAQGRPRYLIARKEFF